MCMSCISVDSIFHRFMLYDVGHVFDMYANYVLYNITTELKKTVII